MDLRCSAKPLLDEYESCYLECSLRALSAAGKKFFNECMCDCLKPILPALQECSEENHSIASRYFDAQVYCGIDIEF